LIHLDSHVVIWLSTRRLNQLSAKARALIEREPVFVSPMVLLELEMLFERQKIDREPVSILGTLESSMSLSVSETAFAPIVEHARTFAWTRDPFDRLIVANAMAEGTRLLTADQTILTNFKDAVW
jgi:PIN domain nuclease of toxin-antitoxin system